MYIIIAVILLLLFSVSFFIRYRNNGTIALHRDPGDRRRKRSESVESPEITQGWQI